MREWLTAAGCPVDPIDAEPEDRTRGVQIRPLSRYQNSVFDLAPCGGCGYMLDVAIINPRSRPFTVCEVAVELPWEDSQFFWLEDPRELSPAREE